MKPPSQDELEADLARLDTGIRQLKTQYDMFLAGALKTPPRELRARLETIIRRHSNRPAGNYVQRFRLNALVSRFNSYAELWGKRVRSLEEGDHRTSSEAERLGIRDRLVARCRVQDVQSSSGDLRRLHSRYVDAQRRAGTSEAKLPSYEAFVRSVSNQTQRMCKERGCESVELRLIERDDVVRLKARPAR